MDDLPVSEAVVIPGTELRVSFSRSSGPGGQNVNKVESKVELRWTPGESAALSEEDRAWLLRLAGKLTQAGELVITSSRTRDQGRNREDALAKLALLVQAALERPKRRKCTRPSQQAIKRRLEEKKRRASIKRDRRGKEE